MTSNATEWRSTISIIFGISEYRSENENISECAMSTQDANLLISWDMSNKAQLQGLP